MDELCSLLNETFSSSQLTSPIHPSIKRGCVPLESEPKSKLIKLCEFNSETALPLEIIDDKMETDNDVPDISFGLRVDYTSFQTQLGIFFGHGISIYGTRPDGNCLYRALSHAIFGTENHFSALKQNLINTFIAIPEHHYNVMRQSGLLNDQEFHEHIDTISAPNEWGTDVELRMLGALAGIDILSVRCTDATSVNWNVLAYYIHNHSDTPSVCEPIFETQKLCLLHHRLNLVEVNEHFDILYLDQSIYT